MADNMDTYDAEARPYEDDNYPPPRDRSRSPLPDRDGDSRIRDEPSNGRGDRDREPAHEKHDPHTVNPGSNLFVTGIHPRLTEEEVSRLFEKYGAVEKCNIMKDPHTRESRGFGFVKMYTAEEADAAKEALQGEVYEGRTLSIEKARRARPRTPTPGKYFGPPKRDDAPPRRGGYRDRYDDRGYGRRDDRRGGGGGGGGYRDRYDDRGYGRRDDYGGPRSDRYRDDRYGDRGGDRGDRGGDRGDRRGYGGGGYDRPPRGAPADRGDGYGGDAGGAPRDGPRGDTPRDGPPARSYEDRPSRYD